MLPISRKVFRAYDIRGVVNKDFDPQWVQTLGKACGAFFLSRGHDSAVIAHDCRHTSPEYQDHLAAGLASTGMDVVQLGMVPTPVQYFGVKKLARQAGVMITASHNPSQYNGFKVWEGLGTIHTDDIYSLCDIMQAGEFPQGRGVICDHDMVPTYLDELAAQFRLESPIKVVLDGGNGAGGLVCAELLRRIGAEVVELYCEPDGDFPNHHPDPLIEANLEDLKVAVLREGADLGLGLDGDADRIGVIDETGKMINGDEMLAVYARDVLEAFPGATVLGDVKCTHRLFQEIESLGGKPIMCVTGHSVVKARMWETGAKLGGELSGHMFFNDRYYGFDDALYACARTVEIASKRAAGGEPVSRFLAHWPKTFATPEIHVPCPDEHKFSVVSKAVAHFRQNNDIIDIDGVRIVYNDGWALLRASNTQPVLVLRFEAESRQRLAEIRKLLETPLKGWIAEICDSDASSE